MSIQNIRNKHAIVQSVWTEVFRNVRFLYKAHIPKKRGTYYTETVYTATVSQAWGKVSLLSSAHSAEWTRNIHSACCNNLLEKCSRRPLQVHLNLPLKGCINAPSIIDTATWNYWCCWWDSTDNIVNLYTLSVASWGVLEGVFLSIFPASCCNMDVPCSLSWVGWRQQGHFTWLTVAV